MKIVYCNKLSDIPDYPLMQGVEDKPGWENRVINDPALNSRTVYKHGNYYWVPFKKQPEGVESDNAN